MEVRIGCTGWSYEPWVDTFYPKNLQNSNFLKYYSSIFDVTEVNSTFYRIPNQFMTKKWNKETPPNFRFTAKLPKSITHEKRLQNIQSEFEEFLKALEPLKAKILALVIQLPPSFSFDEARPRLEELIQILPKHYKFPIEGRHQSWFTETALSFLCEKNLCLVWSEVAGIDNPAPLTSDYVYLRLIGDRTIPEKEFGKVAKNQDNLLKKWKEKLDAIKDKAKLAVIVSNNRFEGFGPATSNKLRTLFGMPEAIWYEKSQKRIGDF